MLKKTRTSLFALFATTILDALLGTGISAQPTQYITDKLYAPLRAEEGEKGKIINNDLMSGATVTVLEKNEKTGYAKVRTADNLEGWIRLQYLSVEPVARVELEQLNSQFAKLQAEKTRIASELVGIKQMYSSQIDVHQRNAELVKQNQLLISEKEVLQMDNERLKDRSSRTWFLYGGFLVAISALIAALIPRLSKKRRNDGWL